ncbi:hypothetical protein Harman_10620 [Haloarcula mannanilytica]|uniref:Halobacterial output domain-containing protein n=1 Tax=Haloarcula mannanilytica TaxID=2509225 RepID=A0A4C2EHC7_9EURY|nr:HalOD1 output domain-containing protein [Haloarcula mannanilytica]GCF13127.1 hypothetical protein Harman_10620 [Haloarcula mannanilytica]
MSGSDNRSERAPDSSDILHAEFDWTVISPSLAIVQTVAIAADRKAIELPPLIETVDPDALDELFQYPTEPDSNISLSFRLGDYEVTVTEHGDVYVHNGRLGS